MRFKIPKAVRYHMVRMLENQLKMDQAAAAKTDGKGRRKSSAKRLVHHESFPESLALLEIRAASGAAEPETLWFWKQALETEGQSGGGADVSLPEAADEGVRRPRRRRRRRKPDHAASDS